MKPISACRFSGIFQILGSTLCGLAVLASTHCAPAQSPTELVTFSDTVWKFNDSGVDPGSNWNAVAYPGESAWASGKALFGVESSWPYPYPYDVQTPMVLGAGRMAYYFRTRFPFNQDTASQLVRLDAFVDDGAVFYLNGAEVGRVRMPAGAISYTNRAQLANPEGVPVLLDLQGSTLVRGENVLAVEIHQNSVNSSDVIFGASLTATLAIAPFITTPDEPTNRTVLQGRATTLSITATGAPPPTFQWFKDGSPVAEATDSNLTLAGFTSGLAGNYFVIASNFFGAATSRTAVVTYQPDTVRPAILYALGQPDLYNILVVFTEAPEPSTGADPFNWSLHNASDGSFETPRTGEFIDGTNLTLTSITPRDPAASYFLRIEGTVGDEFGNVIPEGTEVPVALFETSLIAQNGTNAWRYDQSGTDRGNAWTNAAYNDSAWSNGLPIFDVSRDLPDAVPPFCRTNVPSTGEEVRTCLTLSNAQDTAQLPAIYFRTRFRFEGDAAHSALRLRALVDDGAVFYLNGAEIVRLRMPSGVLTYQTLASETVPTPTREFIEIAALGLVTGENVLAVEVHQDSLTSPDLTFGLELLAVVPSLAVVVQPILEVGQSGGNITLTWTPPTGTLEAAGEPAGPWVAVVPSDPPNRHVAPLNAAPRRFYRVVVP